MNVVLQDKIDPFVALIKAARIEFLLDDKTKTKINQAEDIHLRWVRAAMHCEEEAAIAQFSQETVDSPEENLTILDLTVSESGASCSMPSVGAPTLIIEVVMACPGKVCFLLQSKCTFTDFRSETVVRQHRRSCRG